MSDDMCLLLKASSADRAEENLVLRHMGHAVRDQEPASLVVVGAVPPSASGIVELESRHWKADVVVVDVRPYQGISAIEVFAVTLPFARQTLRIYVGATDGSSGAGDEGPASDTRLVACSERGRQAKSRCQSQAEEAGSGARTGSSTCRYFSGAW
ncbi:hypothetical protein KCU64_g25, partial [Aureobasidium melanogenum]